MKRLTAICLTVLMLLTQLVLVWAPQVSAVTYDSAYYDAVLASTDTYFINPAWDTASLTAGQEITIWFRGSDRTLSYDASKHFSSWADCYKAVYGGDLVTIDNYVSFCPTFVFAPATYTEYIHIPTQATLMGPQAGISPNADITDADKTLEYVEKNGGWAANPNRNGTDNEAIFTNAVHFTTRSDGNGDGLYDDQVDLAYKYGWLREKAHALDNTFVYRAYADGITVSYGSSNGAIRANDYDQKKVLTWDADDPMTVVTSGKTTEVTVRNSIDASNNVFVQGWNGSRVQYHFIIENCRSVTTKSNSAQPLVYGYLDELTLKDSYISNGVGRLTHAWFMNNQRNIDPKISILGNIFYNNTTTSKNSGNGALISLNPSQGKKLTVDVTNNVFYNAFNHSEGLLLYKNVDDNTATKGNTSINFTDNVIHHDIAGQTQLMTVSDITGGTNVFNFNRNRITGVITDIINDYTDITNGAYTFNFNYNFLGENTSSTGVEPTFALNGMSQDVYFDWQNPIYYTDYAMTTLGEYTTDGVTFTDQSSVAATKKLTAVPHTYQAWVRVPQTMTGFVGNIMSNYTHGTHPYVSFEIMADGVPRVRWFDAMGVQYETEFHNVSVNNGEWTHVTITVEPETGIARCYINGEYADMRYYYPEIDKNIINNPIMIGANHSRDISGFYFQGKLRGIDLYADVRTADEIRADYQNGADLTDTDLLASYDLSAKSAGGVYTDNSANAAHALDGTLWMTEEEMEVVRGNVFDEDFDRRYNLVVVGDTQMTVQNDANTGKTATQTLYKYIVDNIDTFNSQYVIGVGDITDDDNTKQWNVAYNAITQMDGKIGYSLVRGNHDVINDATLGVTNFNKYFASHQPYASQFTGENGGAYEEGSVHNTWTTFSIGETEYLLVNIDWIMSDGVLDWANEVIAAHPDHRVIISTHAYLAYDGTHINDTFGSGASAYNTGSGLVTSDASLNNGDDLWRKVVSQHENIELVFCGHMMSERIAVEQREGKNGNTVTELLINLQGIDNISNPHKGLGFVTNLFFNEQQNKIELELYSTVLERYYRPANQLAIDLAVEGDEVVLQPSADKPAGTGTADDPYLVSSPDHLLWMASQTESGTTASLDGVYFKQTQDIDLMGTTIRQIGVSFSADDNMQAFGGVYDGNGYVIKNGTVTCSKANNSLSRGYGYGLFGVIYGAEIKNVTLEDITVSGRGVSGMIVGRAAAPLDGSATNGFNKITNCVVKGDCSFPLQLPSWRSHVSSYDTNNHTGVVGSIVGMAHATQISYCSSSLTMNMPGSMASSGGIAGTVGYNSSVDHCLFDGAINIVDNSALCTNNLGGIVGYISPTKNASVNGITTAMRATPVSITSCVNMADITYTGTAAMTQNLCIGGILGGHGWQTDFVSELEYQHLMENCYNLGDINVGDVHAESTKIWIGGLVGKGLCTDDSEQLEMWLKDCASVDVTERDNGEGVGTNEYRNEDKKNSSGYYGVMPVGDTVKTLTADEMSDELAVISGETELYRHGVMHELVTIPAQEVSCTQDGWDEYIACTECEYTYGLVKYEAPGHSLTEIEGKDTSYSAPGYRAHSYCSVCGTYFDGDTVIDDIEAWKLGDGMIAQLALPDVVKVDANTATLTADARRVYWGYIGTENTDYTWFDEFKAQAGDSFMPEYAPKAGDKYTMTKVGFYRFVINYVDDSGNRVDIVRTIEVTEGIADVAELTVSGNNAQLSLSDNTVRKIYWGYIGEQNTPYEYFDESIFTEADFSPKDGDTYLMKKAGYYRFVVNYKMGERYVDAIYTVYCAADADSENAGTPVITQDGNVATLDHNSAARVNKLYVAYNGETEVEIDTWEEYLEAAVTRVCYQTPVDGAQYTLGKTGYYTILVNYFNGSKDVDVYYTVYVD